MFFRRPLNKENFRHTKKRKIAQGMNSQTNITSCDSLNRSTLGYYNQNPLLQAKMYVYLLDTVITSPVFPQVVRRLTRHNDPCANRMWTTKSTHSNLFIASYACLRNITRNFELNKSISKKDAVLIEKGIHPVYKSVGYFCNKIYTKNRYKVADNTIYAENEWRSIYYYPFSGLFKPIKH